MTTLLNFELKKKTLSTVSLMPVRGCFFQIINNNNNNNNNNNTLITFGYGIIVGFERDTILATGVIPRLLGE
jgi:hypothetical protein